MSATFTSVAEAQQIARRNLPKSVYQAFSAVSGTCADNLRALRDVGFRPRVGTRYPRIELATTVLGRAQAMPVIASPVGGLRLAHRDAETGVARAAAGAGLPVGVSTSAHHRIEDIARGLENPVWYQLYLAGGRAAAEGAIERAQAAGCSALVLTIDMLGAGLGTRANSARNRVPNQVTVRNALRYAPELMVRPRWLADYAREGLTLKAANVRPAPGGPPLTFADALPINPTWADMAWISEQWHGPIVIKGIMRTDDAKRAVDAGAAAVVVSNHGGLVLDGVPGTLRSLPGVAAAVGDQAEVLFDGGVRTGGDIVKALALGARAVLCGRACLWGLAAHGQVGVSRVLGLLRDELELTLNQLGCPSVHDLEVSDLDLPFGWPARLGPLG
jgi:isopentenyl diphosphate isomerase/L-lactate dehydrogenase-like FMN-dependent dehydrogenase